MKEEGERGCGGVGVSATTSTSRAFTPLQIDIERVFFTFQIITGQKVWSTLSLLFFWGKSRAAGKASVKHKHNISFCTPDFLKNQYHKISTDINKKNRKDDETCRGVLYCTTVLYVSFFVRHKLTLRISPTRIPRQPWSQPVMTPPTPA